MRDDTATKRAGRRAKMVLWVAIGLFALSQCLSGASLDAMDSSRGWWFLSMKELLPYMISDYSGGYGLNRLFGNVGSLLLTFLFSLLVCPWLVDFLSKARPVLWVARLLMTAAAGFVTRHLLSTEFSGKGFSWSPLLTTGLFWAFAAVILNTIGLWMIPKAVGYHLAIAREIPATDEHR
jgi:hypothetical protein